MTFEGQWKCFKTGHGGGQVIEGVCDHSRLHCVEGQLPLGSNNADSTSEAMQGSVSNENVGFMKQIQKRFSSRIITGNDTWICHCSPEMKQDSVVNNGLLTLKFSHNH
jgi:hypothetical protein